MRARLGFVATLVMGLTLVAAPAASAAKPFTLPMDRSDAFTFDAGMLCSFPVDVAFHQVGFETYFATNDGTPLKKIEHFRETDVLSANGVTLTGIPYEVNVYFAVDSEFNFTRIDASGGFFHIPLPGGQLFVSAGHMDMDGNFVGNPGNADALCEALAGA